MLWSTKTFSFASRSQELVRWAVFPRNKGFLDMHSMYFYLLASFSIAFYFHFFSVPVVFFLSLDILGRFKTHIH
jgi:hypothetical protein